MSQIEFPSGVDWSIVYTAPADYLGVDVSPKNTRYFYYEASNPIIKIGFDMSKVIDASYMFGMCRNVGRIIGLGGDATANVINASNMFYYCSSLPDYPSARLPLMNLDKVTNTTYMFNNVGKEDSPISIGNMSLPSATETQNMFSGASVSSIGDIYCPKSKNFATMFGVQARICKAIGEVDATSCTGTSGPMGYSDFTKLTDMGGFKNLKVSWTSYAFEKCPNLTVESLMNIINNLYDWSGNTDGKAPLYDGTMYSFGTTHKMSFGSTNLAKLSEEQIAVATNKGWTLV